MNPEDRRKLELLRTFATEGAVRIPTSVADVRAVCEPAGLSASLGPDSRIVIESVFLLDGGSVLRISPAVTEPTLFPHAWAAHSKNTGRALAPLDDVKARAEQFSNRARWGSRGLAAVSFGLGGGGAWKSAIEHWALGWAALSLLGLAGTLTFTWFRRWIGRRILRAVLGTDLTGE